MQSCKIQLDQVAGHYRILLAQVWSCSIAMVRDRGEELRKGKGRTEQPGLEEQKEEHAGGGNSLLALLENAEDVSSFYCF